MNWNQFKCLFCGNPCIADQTHPERRLVFNVTLHYRETILKYCSNCQNDNSSEDVKRKVLSCNDLVHAEAKYQDDCRKLFTNLKYNEASLLRLAGRPRKEIEQDNFIRFCEWWKGEEDSFSVVELHEKNEGIG